MQMKHFKFIHVYFNSTSECTQHSLIEYMYKFKIFH